MGSLVYHRTPSVNWQGPKLDINILQMNKDRLRQVKTNLEGILTTVSMLPPNSLLFSCKGRKGKGKKEKDYEKVNESDHTSSGY